MIEKDNRIKDGQENQQKRKLKWEMEVQSKLRKMFDMIMGSSVVTIKTQKGEPERLYSKKRGLSRRYTLVVRLISWTVSCSDRHKSLFSASPMEWVRLFPIYFFKNIFLWNLYTLWTIFRPASCPWRMNLS